MRVRKRGREREGEGGREGEREKGERGREKEGGKEEYIGKQCSYKSNRVRSRERTKTVNRKREVKEKTW